MQRAMISIITICYNEADRIRRTVESVLSQKFSDYEYIVVDGGSKDGTLEIIQEYAGRIDSLSSGMDKGIYDAMNIGASKATGNYLIFLNGGDYFSDQHVISDIFKKKQSADLIFGYLKNEQGEEIKNLKKINVRKFIHKETLPHQATFINASFFEKVGGYRTDYKIAGDYDFFARAILKHRGSVKYVERDVAIFDENGISNVETELCYLEVHRVFDEIRAMRPLYYFWKDVQGKILWQLGKFHR